MGVSTDAILGYGYCWNNEIDTEDDDRFDGDFYEWLEEAQERVTGVRLGTHCSGDYPMLFVVLSGYETRAWRGYPKVGEVEMPFAKPLPSNAAATLKAAIQTLGLDEPHEPGWFLCSDWN